MAADVLSCASRGRSYVRQPAVYYSRKSLKRSGSAGPWRWEGALSRFAVQDLHRSRQTGGQNRFHDTLVIDVRAPGEVKDLEIKNNGTIQALPLDFLLSPIMIRRAYPRMAVRWL